MKLDLQAMLVNAIARLDAAEREIKALKAEQELTSEAMRRAEASQASHASAAYDPSGVYL